MFTSMKSLFGLFAVLFCLVSIGGIGQTTSDPDQNSTTISADINVPDSAIVVNQIPMGDENVFSLDVNSENDLAAVSFLAIQNLSNEQKFVLSEHVKQPDPAGYSWRNANPTVYITQKNPGGVLSIFYN